YCGRRVVVKWSHLKHGCFILLLSAMLSACSKPEADNVPLPEDADSHNPQAAVYNVQLGIGYLREGNITRAKTKLLLAQSQDPTSPDVWDALAFFYESTGNDTLADRYYLKAISLDSKRGSSLNNYGVYLCKKGQYRQSLTYFSQAVADPAYVNVASTYENAGLCAEEIPDMATAQKFFILALDNNPVLSTSTLELAEINFENGKFDLASKYLQRYNQLAKPTSESLWLDLRLAQQAKDKQKVAADATLLADNFPDSDEYKQAKLSGLIPSQ
ncbi:MAG: type IV pilus biogenesis/stability protein PilW, partial [Gammaproteobacteria bacterium]